jgi:hypothetical protein
MATPCPWFLRQSKANGIIEQEEKRNSMIDYVYCCAVVYKGETELAREANIMVRSTRQLRHELAAHAHQIAGQIRGVPRKPVRACVRSRTMQVCVEVNPVNAAETQAFVKYPGLFLSAFEQLVWGVVDEKTPLVAKEIAVKIGRAYDAKLKYLLLNLEDRGVLTHEDGRGYLRARQVNPGERG